MEQQTMEQIKKAAVLRTLELTKGNKVRAAKILQVTRETIARILKKETEV